MTYAQVAARVRKDKEAHPERYCSDPRCLYRVALKHYATGKLDPLPDCPGGRCPRHQRALDAVPEWAKRERESRQ